MQNQWYKCKFDINLTNLASEFPWEVIYTRKAHMYTKIPCQYSENGTFHRSEPVEPFGAELCQFYLLPAGGSSDHWCLSHTTELTFNDLPR